MKLTVKNLGAISHAEIDLSKDLILFTGENNTGKTYLAYTIYGLYDLKDKLPLLSDSEILDEDEKNNREVLNLELKLSSHLNDLIKQLQLRLMSIFANTKDNFKNTKLSIQNSKILKKILFEKAAHFWYLDANDSEINKIENSFDVLYAPSFDDNSVAEYVITHLIFHNRTFIFTAERSGINVFSKELSLIKGRLLSSLLKNGKNQALTDLLKDRINRYSEPIQDELETSERYDILQKGTSVFNYLANELETAFLNGRVHASQSGDLRFTMEDSKKELEIHATSSTVKSLSPLVFYLRHIAQKNDFIIIDEPELNLHPNNQRKIARFMGRLIQEGFKILVSTHSDYIVRELNNLIMLHSGTQQKPEIAQDLLKTHGYAANELLDKERVGVYLFRLGKPVEAVSVTDTGFSVATIDEEASKLNQTSQDIYFNLFDE